MNMTRCLITAFLIFLVLQLALADNENENEDRNNFSDDDDDSSSDGHRPAFCRRFKYNGQPKASFTRRFKLMIDDLNLGRLNNEVWQNPTQTYGIILGSPFFQPIAPEQYFWNDSIYNEAQCRFEITQVWPALDPTLQRIVYRVQTIAATLQRPTFRANGQEGPSTLIPTWITPPLFEHAGILAADAFQVLTGQRAADSTFVSRATGKELNNEQRSILISNQRRYYNSILQLDAIPPGFATSELHLFWYSTITQAPRDVAIALRKYYAGQLPLLPDPTNPGLPGFPNIYIYVPPATVRSEDSPVTVDNITYRPNNATAAAELYKDYLRRLQTAAY